MAGSAGTVPACRLSQDRNIRVAHIEAGGPDDAPEIKLPVAFPQLFKTKYDWDFASEPEPGLGNRRIYLPWGKTVGGSSAINPMIYIRGNAADFDGWACCTALRHALLQRRGKRNNATLLGRIGHLHD